MATPVGVDPAPSPPAVDGGAAEPAFLWELRKYVLLLATLAATVTYSAGLSPPGGFWFSNSGGERHAGLPVLRDMYSRRYLVFFYCNATAFVASLVVVGAVLLVPRNQRIRRCTLRAAMTLGFVGLIGAFTAAGGYGRTQISTYVIALAAAVLSFAVIKLRVLLYYPVKNLIHEALRRYLQFGRLEHRIDEEQQSRASERADDDAYQILRKSHKHLLLLGILSAIITYQAVLNPPGGIWQDNAADGRPHNLAGDPVLDITYPRRYQVFFYCNATAFVASLVILVLLLSNTVSTQRIKYRALHAAMILDLFGLMGAYAAGSCRKVSKSVYISVIVVAVFLYVGIHCVVFMTREAARKKMEQRPPGWLKDQVFEGHTVGEAAAAMEQKLEKRRKLMLLLAILAASVTYQAGMSPPGGLWQENNSGHLGGDPVVNGNFRRRYKAFFYCNAMSFVASLVITVLLVNKRLSVSGIRSHALVCLIIGLMGALGAYGAGSYRKISMVDVLFLFLAVIVCISLQIALFVSGSARGPVQRLVPELGWPQVLGVEDDHGSGAPSLSTPREQLVSPLFHGACKVIDSLRSGTWMLILVWVIWMPSLRPNLKVKFKVSKIWTVLGVLLVSAARMTATTTMDTPSTATPPGTSMVRRRRYRPLSQAEVEPTRPRRNRRPNSRLIGQDWVN